jgi:hypothetical protein
MIRIADMEARMAKALIKTLFILCGALFFSPQRAQRLLELSVL